MPAFDRPDGCTTEWVKTPAHTCMHTCLMVQMLTQTACALHTVGGPVLGQVYTSPLPHSAGVHIVHITLDMICLLSNWNTSIYVVLMGATLTHWGPTWLGLEGQGPWQVACDGTSMSIWPHAMLVHMQLTRRRMLHPVSLWLCLFKRFDASVVLLYYCRPHCPVCSGGWWRHCAVNVRCCYSQSVMHWSCCLKLDVAYTVCWVAQPTTPKMHWQAVSMSLLRLLRWCHVLLAGNSAGYAGSSDWITGAPRARSGQGTV